MSKPPGLLRFERLRIAFWIYLVCQQHGGEDSEIDSDLYEALGISFPADQRAPKATELLGQGHAPRKSLRGLTIHDFVKAASRMLGNDSAERMFHSNIWLTVLPRKRTIVDVVRAIRHMLRRNQLWRMSEKEVIALLSWRQVSGTSPARTDGHFVSVCSTRQLRDLFQQKLLPEEDWSVLMVLLHQEAFLSCQEDEADTLRVQALPHAIASAREFFRDAPVRFRAELSAFEKALFYPPAKIDDGPRKVIRSARYVHGLVLPRFFDERGRVIRRPSHHLIWTALQKSDRSGHIGGTG